jgi:type I restriction enzyme S subunit
MELPRTSWKALSKLEVPVPPITDQRRMVELLAEVDLHRDAATATLERTSQTLASFQQAVLAAACSGRLTEDWRSSHELSDVDEWLRELQSGRAARKDGCASSGKTSGLTSERQLEDIPQSWRLVELGDVFDVATGATPLRTNSSYYEDGTIPWVTSGAVNERTIIEPTEQITDLALRETNAKLFPKGTLLVAMYGEGQTRGRVAELGIEAATNQAVAAILFSKTTESARSYLRLFFEDSYQRIRRLSFGGVQPNLSLRVIKNTLIPMPPPEEQAEIVRFVNELFSRASRVLAETDSATRLLDETGRAALAKAFRGELV